MRVRLEGIATAPARDLLLMSLFSVVAPVRVIEHCVQLAQIYEIELFPDGISPLTKVFVQRAINASRSPKW